MTKNQISEIESQVNRLRQLLREAEGVLADLERLIGLEIEDVVNDKPKQDHAATQQAHVPTYSASPNASPNASHNASHEDFFKNWMERYGQDELKRACRRESRVNGCPVLTESGELIYDRQSGPPPGISFPEGLWGEQTWFSFTPARPFLQFLDESEWAYSFYDPENLRKFEEEFGEYFPGVKALRTPREFRTEGGLIVPVYPHDQNLLEAEEAIRAVPEYRRWVDESDRKLKSGVLVDEKERQVFLSLANQPLQLAQYAHSLVRPGYSLREQWHKRLRSQVEPDLRALIAEHGADVVGSVLMYYYSIAQRDGVGIDEKTYIASAQYPLQYVIANFGKFYNLHQDELRRSICSGAAKTSPMIRFREALSGAIVSLRYSFRRFSSESVFEF